ncbi:MAG: hypothetical protein QW156_03955 [Candidatus Aenigmatarchaeota archaeon]
MKYKIYLKLDRLITTLTMMHIKYNVMYVDNDYVIVDLSNNSFRALKKLFALFLNMQVQVENLQWEGSI